MFRKNSNPNIKYNITLNITKCQWNLQKNTKMKPVNKGLPTGKWAFLQIIVEKCRKNITKKFNLKKHILKSHNIILK